MEDVDAPGGSGIALVTASRDGEVITEAQETFGAVLDKVRWAASAIIINVRTLRDPPDEIRVEFGLKMGAKAETFIVMANMETSSKVTLEWKREAPAGK